MQEDTIRSFRQGKLNLLISTSVAEEGLDIPDCNLVIRYGLLTNEIAQQQASGRARAQNSQYSVVAEEGGREVRREKTNEYLEELTGQAVERVQQMSPEDFRTKVRAWFSFFLRPLPPVSIITFKSFVFLDQRAAKESDRFQKSSRDPTDEKEELTHSCQRQTSVSEMLQTCDFRK